ncbi:MAG: DnaJ domain-containing protein [Chloroflexota bacterium]
MFDPSWSSLGLTGVAARLAMAQRPEDLFGGLDGDRAAQLDRIYGIYRQLALAVHPDRHASEPLAQTAFQNLQHLYTLAKQQVLGWQSVTDGPVTITSRRAAYTIQDVLAEGDLAVLYTAMRTASSGNAAGGASCEPVVLKVAGDGLDNDLIQNEASALRQLHGAASGSPAPPYLPRLAESFICRDASGVERAANVFPLVQTAQGSLPAREFVTLRELRAAYPAGLDPRHMAWIWRRVLIALGHAHGRGIVHGAVLPEHLLIHPADHGLLLVDWSASVNLQQTPGAPVPVISPDYEGWYPARVLARKPARPAVDLLMGLRCMTYLLGGEPLTGELPTSVPAPLQAYLRGALHLGLAGLDAARLYRDFSDLLARLWGQRRFIPLTMPARS